MPMAALISIPNVLLWMKRGTHLMYVSNNCYFDTVVPKIEFKMQPTVADTICNLGLKDYCPVACNNCNLDGKRRSQ